MVQLGRAACRLILAIGPASCVGHDPPPPASVVTPPPATSVAAAAREEPRHGPLGSSVVSFPSGSLTLHGFLYRPDGPGPFPGVVFAHGSEPQPSNGADQAEFYIPRGFVLFVPHRRGHGESAHAGPYYASLPATAAALDAFLEEEADDVMAAVDYVHTLPYVDGGRVAVVGCWFGGVDALLAAERGKGIAAAVDFGGAVQPWHASVILQDRLKLAARNARVPVFFLQAANDFDTKPTVELGAAMQAAGKPTRVRVLPPFGSSSFEGHSFCMRGGETQWGPEVLDFLQTTMGHRPPM